jgi:hypothetical protein
MAISKDKRDNRDPAKLYKVIKQIQKNNPGMSITTAADMADRMSAAINNGKSNKSIQEILK